MIYDNLIIQNKNDIELLEKGISTNNLFIYYKNKNLYIQEGSIRCFYISFKRLRNTLMIKSDDDIKLIIVNNIKSINIIKKHENLHYMNIYYPHYCNIQFIVKKDIKLKEINNFLQISNTDNNNIIIKKLNEKINILLNKIDEYKSKSSDEVNTDDEIIIMY